LQRTLLGDVATAQAAIPSILSRHPAKDPYYHHAAYVVACIYAIGGHSAEAVKWLREAVATGLSTYPLFERTALLDRVRQAPEFVQFMADIEGDDRSIPPRVRIRQMTRRSSALVPTKNWPRRHEGTKNLLKNDFRTVLILEHFLRVRRVFVASSWYLFVIDKHREKS